MDNDRSKIEQLKKRLYSVSEEQQDFRRTRLSHHASQVSTAWTEEGQENEPPKIPMQKHYDNPRKRNILKRILAVAVFALLAASGFAYYVFTTGGNYISANAIDVKIIGPVATPAGETLTLDVDVYNGNPEKLEAVDLIISYPEGTRKADDRLTTVLSDRLPVGEIESGQTVRRRIQVILFGEENIKKEIVIKVEYRVPGSIILFNKEKTYPIFIGSAPISVDITNFKEVVPNQSTTFKAVITSNSKDVVRNLIFRADYPTGFKFENAMPAASSNNNVWTLGDVNPGEKREIEITGQIIGDANVERYFGFVAGTQDPLDRSKIGVALVESKEKILIKKPFLSADISLNREGGATYIGYSGEPIRGEIVWQNNLNVPIYDVVLEMKLAGGSLDKKSVVAEQGFYSSQNNMIAWDRNIVGGLSEVQPGATGSFQFALASLPPTVQNSSTLRRQQIDLNLTIKAKRLSEDRVPEEIKSTTSRTIKIASILGLNARAVRNVGPFENTGPIPPAAEQTTTYTVLNSVTNSFNNVKDVTYKATLPSYVTWLGKIYPETAAANVKYNADTREITWSLGDMAPGVGFNSSAKEFSYQISITPSVSQVGQAPVLVNPQTLAGTDTFTGNVIQTQSEVITTDIQGDPQFQFGWEKVVD